MRYETVSLRREFAGLGGSGDFEPTLTAYCPDNSREIDADRRRVSVIVFPGGGYSFTSDREAEPVALKFAAMGMNAFVLRYSVQPQKYPSALLQAAAAVAYVREHADEYHASPEQIAVCGFSAGGHLACSIGVFWNRPLLTERLGRSAGAFRPDAMILGYPVVSTEPKPLQFTFTNLLGDDASPEQIAGQSAEKFVTKETPPAFLWHTFNDDCVPVEHSLLLAQALRKNGVPFEMHIYPDGPHGLSTASRLTAGGEAAKNPLVNPHVATWIPLCGEWLAQVFPEK